MNSPARTVTDVGVVAGDDAALAALGVDLLDAVLDAADVSTIGVTSWWDRATSALITGVSTGASVRRVISVMLGKLQVTTAPGERVAGKFARVEALLADPATFERWRRLVEQDAVYVAAMCRLRRSERSEAYKAKKTAGKGAAVPRVEDATEEIPF